MNCPRSNCKNKAQLHPTYGVLPCVKCQEEDRTGKQLKRPPEFYSLSKQARIQQMRDENGKDIIQPFIGNKANPEFAKAYPDVAPNYFTPEDLAQID